MANETNLPKSLVLDKKVTAAAAKRESIANEGWFKLAVTKGINREGNNKDLDGKEKISRLQMVITLAPLKNPKDAKSAVHDLAIQKYLILPDRGPNSPDPASEEEELQEQAKKVRQLTKDLRAVFGPEEVPYAPRKNESGRYEYDGEEVTKEEYEACIENLSERALALAYKMWEDSDRWVTPKKFVYAKVVQQVGNDGVSRPNVLFLVDKLPDDASLLEYSEWFRAPAAKGE